MRRVKASPPYALHAPSTRAEISQINLAPISLARLIKNTRKSLIWKFGAEYVEGGLDLGMYESFRQHRSKRLGFAGLAAQRLGQRPDKAGILPGCLNLNAHETARRRATTV